VGCWLAFFTQAWKQITDDKWVLSTIQHGLKLDFIQMSPWLGIKKTKVNMQTQNVLDIEIQALLQKHVINVVPPNLAK